MGANASLARRVNGPKDPGGSPVERRLLDDGAGRENTGGWVIDVDADRSTRRAKKVPVLVAAVLVTALATSGSLGAETRAKAGSKTTTTTLPSNDGVYQASTPETKCNPPTTGLYATELKFTVTGTTVTLIVTAQGVAAPPILGSVGADGTFSAPPYSGTFHDGSVQGSLHVDNQYGVCDLSFAGQGVLREDSGARISHFAGEVEYWCPPDTERLYLRLESVLYVGCHIATAPDSYVVVSFADLSTYKMGENSEIELTSGPKQSSLLELFAGKLWVNIKRVARGETLEVYTHETVTGVKGTIFVLEEAGDTSTVKVIKGRVSFKSKATGKTKKVRKGEMATADGDGLGKVTKFDVKAEKAAWKQPSSS